VLIHTVRRKLIFHPPNLHHFFLPHCADRLTHELLSVYFVILIGPHIGSQNNVPGREQTMSSRSFSEADVYMYAEGGIGGIKPTMSMMHNKHHEKAEGDLSLDESPTPTPTGDKNSAAKKKGMGVMFGNVEVAPPPKKTIGFGTVFVEPETKEEEAVEGNGGDEEVPPPPPSRTNPSMLPRSYASLIGQTIEDAIEEEEEEEEEPDFELDPVAERYFQVSERFFSDLSTIIFVH
jgi:hypothetical protein